MKKMRTSIRGRLILISLLCILLGIIGCVIISNATIKRIGQQQIERTMRTRLSEEMEHLETCYFTMIRLMLQLSKEGSAGQMVLDYVDVDNNFDKYVKKRELQNELVTITFPDMYVNFLAYIDSDTQTELLEELPIEVENTSYLSNINVFQIGDNIFQAMHCSDTRFRSGVVVSVLRVNQPFGSRNLDIYIEMKSNVVEYGREIEEDTLPFIFAQLTPDKQVCYCNGPMFEIGQTLEIPLDDNGNFEGKLGEYFLVARKSSMGFLYFVAVPQQMYRQDFMVWYLHIAILCMIAIIPASFVTVAVWKYIGKPIQQLEKEIVAVGNGNLELASENMAVDEFKKLMQDVNEMKLRIQELLVTVQKEETEKQKVEREKLMYQINPHFVLNSLNSIQWMAAMEHQTDLSSFVADLKSLLAYNLGKEQQRSTLRTEIEMGEKYINLQKKRYDFTASIQVEEGDYLSTETIRMLLQPLIENSLRYGLGEPGRIDICVSRDPTEEYAVITIQDYGQGLDSQRLAELNEPFRYRNNGREENKGIGLRYVRSCLEGFYGGNAFLTVNSTLGKGTKITILIPIRKEREEV